MATGLGALASIAAEYSDSELETDTEEEEEEKTTTNAVSGGITNNTPDASVNPAESKDFLKN